jgi:hypothetical protein
MRHGCSQSPIFRTSNHSAKLAICFVTVAFVSNGVANAQSSDSAPWAKHDFLPPDIIRFTIKSAQSVAYVPVRRAVKSDPTLSFISADEPVVQAGFPPLPRHSRLNSHSDR